MQLSSCSRPKATRVALHGTWKKPLLTFRFQPRQMYSPTRSVSVRKFVCWKRSHVSQPQIFARPAWQGTPRALRWRFPL